MDYSKLIEQGFAMQRTFIDSAMKLAEMNLNTALLIGEATRKNAEAIAKTTTNIVTSLTQKES